MSAPSVLFDHFHKLINDEVQRGAKNGVSVHVGLGVHPRSINDEVDAVLKELPEYLSHPDVVAIGEIGLERCTAVEERVLRAQLEIGYYPKIIHTPRVGKLEAVLAIVDIVEDHRGEGYCHRSSRYAYDRSGARGGHVYGPYGTTGEVIGTRGSIHYKRIP